MKTFFTSRIATSGFLLTALILGGCAAPPQSVAADAPRATLANAGQAAFPIVVSAKASDKTKTSAQTLADYLQKISGAKFEIQTGDGTTGLAIGTAKDFPALKLEEEFASDDPTKREDYILRSSAKGVLLVGATDLAVSHAVWDFLYRLGYRQFFPGAHWEVMPSTASPGISVNVKEHPDYYARRIWFTYNTWPDNQERMAQWDVKNRATSGIALNTGHAYGGIINRNLAEFEKHPEYLTAPSGNLKRGNQKFCVSNPGLRQLVIDDALKYFEVNPDADSYSVDPSDGGGWESDACPDAKEIGSPSNRVLLLANVVAEAVEKKFPGKRIGFYAYNDHSPPPTIKVHPNVVVSVATAFIKGGFSVDQLVEGWQKQGAVLGVREYYSIIHWDKDLPRGARASNLDYLTRTIPDFYRHDAHYMSAESSDNWGPAGLGYYVAALLMWDVDEAKRVDEIVDDFLSKSFGSAKAPMTKFYELLNGINGAPARPLSEDFVGRMYRHLDAAWKATNDEKIQQRIGDLAMYVRYIELYRDLTSAPGDEHLAKFETLIRNSYRLHPTHMVHSLAQYRTKFRDKNIVIAKEAPYFWQAPEKPDKRHPEGNPWKDSTPFSSQEVRAVIEAGVKNNKLLDFEPKDFSTNLVPATALNLAAVEREDFQLTRNAGNYYVFVPEGKTELQFTMSTGHIYKDRGDTKLMLFEAVDNVADEGQEGENNDENPIDAEPIAQSIVKPTGEPQEITFRVPHPGLYRLRMGNSGQGVILTWPEDQNLVMPASIEQAGSVSSRGGAYFYVPKGTKNIGGFASGAGYIRNAAGEKAYNLAKTGEYFNIPVPGGQDGKLWHLDFAAGNLSLMTVPPYLARSEKELLLPKEVVEADSK